MNLEDVQKTFGWAVERKTTFPTLLSHASRIDLFFE